MMMLNPVMIKVKVKMRIIEIPKLVMRMNIHVFANLAKDISGKLYDLRTWIDEIGSFPAKISIRVRMVVYRDLINFLVQEKNYDNFKGTCFGHLRHIPEHFKFNGQMVHYMLLRRVKMTKIT